MQEHAAKFDAYQGMFHEDKIEELKKFCQLNKILKKKNKVKWTLLLKTSCVIPDLIAKKKNQNHFLMVGLLTNVW